MIGPSGLVTPEAMVGFGILLCPVAAHLRGGAIFCAKRADSEFSQPSPKHR